LAGKFSCPALGGGRVLNDPGLMASKRSCDGSRDIVRIRKRAGKDSPFPAAAHAGKERFLFGIALALLHEDQYWLAQTHCLLVLLLGWTRLNFAIALTNQQQVDVRIPDLVEERPLRGI
jgi:hypothetical protein